MKSFRFNGRLIASIALLSVLMLVLTLAVPANMTSAASDDEQQTKRTINVSGQGVVKAEPNIAYVTLGTVTESKDAKTAQSENARIMDKVVKALKGAGISSSDIKTVEYNISPRYSYDKDTGISSIIGYSVVNNIQVTVRDLGKVGVIIDLAADNGANSSSNITFSLSDYEKHYNEALKAAVENARTRAKTIADTLGIKLDVPVTVTEGGGYGVLPSFSRSMTVEKNEALATPISPGILEIKATVSMTYQY